MEFPRIALGDWVEAGVRFLIEYAAGFFAFIRQIFNDFYQGVFWLLSAPPFWVVILFFAALAWFLKGWKNGWKLSLGVTLGLLIIVSMEMWRHSMVSLALVIVAAIISIVISLPLGIWSAQSDRASRAIRPVLDFMQTMPAFVYLIPALLLFRVGVVPGIVATVIFSLAPGVRLTELGIRGVDKEVVEAGHAFGASPMRILRQIQLPLALPSIMAGVNQIIMLSLSMVVIAGMVGAGGLGGKVVEALQSINLSLGFEAGFAVVIIAMMLDRMTGTLIKTKNVIG
ncbi:MAG: ABC transporter permease subunit [Microbacteriaceae bacterium]